MRQQEPGRRGSSPAVFNGGPPPALRCLACNGSFFASSLPIHQKTCFQRNAFVDMACRKCQAVLRSGLIHTHEASCSGPPAKNVEYKSADDQPAQQLNAPEADGRIRCRNCGRGFHQDRIAKHQSVCHADSECKYPGRLSCRSPVVKPRTSQPVSRSSLTHKAKTTHHASCSLHQAGRRATSSECRVQKITLDLGRSWPDPSENRPDRFRDRRFDPVHRDAAHHERFQSNASSLNSSLQGRSAMLSASNASSSANPLATNRLMTV